jgi:hypothetical protein
MTLINRDNQKSIYSNKKCWYPDVIHQVWYIHLMHSGFSTNIYCVIDLYHLSLISVQIGLTQIHNYLETSSKI